MSVQTLQSKTFTWYHFNQFEAADIDFLHSHFQFHPLDFEDLLSESLLSKLDIYKHYIFATFQIPAIDTADRLVGQELHVFLSADHLVTITPKPIPSLEKFVSRCVQSTKLRGTTMHKGSAFFLYKLLLAAFQDVKSLISRLLHQTESMEQDVYAGDRDATVRLARARRNIVFLRHFIDPQRHILTSISSLKRAFVTEEIQLYYDDLRDLLDNVWLATDNLKLIVDGLFDANEAFISYRTNQIVTVFTILTAGLMGPSLFVGFYGMNVPWLPWIERPLFMSLLFFITVFIMISIVYVVLRGKSRIPSRRRSKIKGGLFSRVD